MDEAISLYTGLEVSKGQIFYQDLMHAKPPGVSFLMGITFYIFGENVIFARILTALVVSLTTFFIYQTAVLMYNRQAAVFSSILYGFACATTRFGGIGWGITEKYMNLFAVISLLYYIKAFKGKDIAYNYILSGFFFVLAVTMKQPSLAILFPFLFLLIRFYEPNLIQRFKATLFLFTGILVGVAPFLLYFQYYELLNELFHWSFGFWIGMDPIVNLYAKIEILYHMSLRYSLYLVLFLFGIYGTLEKMYVDTFKNPKEFLLNFLFGDIKYNKWDILLITWLFSIFVFFYTTPDFYAHYLIQPLLPAVFLCGKGSSLLFNQLKESKELSLKANSNNRFTNVTILVLLSFLLIDYVDNPVIKESSDNAELREVGEYIKMNTTESDKIFAFYDPQIYIYSDRSSATQYFTIQMAFNSMDEIPQTIADELSSNPPKYIVKDNETTSFFKIHYNPILEFLYSNYHLEVSIGGKEIYVLRS